MPQAVDLLGFLVMGLLGGFGHCAGMCSPFVLLVARRQRGADLESRGRLGFRELTPFAWFNAGRAAVYATLGAVAGTIGGAVQFAGGLLGLHRAAMLVAGAALVLSAAAALFHLSRDGRSVVGRVIGRLGARMPAHPAAVGALVGLLPCGLLYSAVAAAVSRGSALRGAAALGVFAAGTMVALTGVATADRLLAGPGGGRGVRRAIVNSLAQVFILGMGAWFLWRGLAH